MFFIEILFYNYKFNYGTNYIFPLYIKTLYASDTKFASSTSGLYNRTKMELSKLIQQFKRAVTLKIKLQNTKSDFKRQRSFYDRVIRNEKELFNIRKYIVQNPLKWNLEKNIINLDI